MDQHVRAALIGGSIATVPYCLLAYAFSRLLNDTSFWEALGWLVAVRCFFSIVELIGSILAWRLHGRKVAVTAFTSALRAVNMPPRYDTYGDIDEYLNDVIADQSQPTDLRIAAGGILGSLQATRQRGMVVTVRMQNAWDLALEAYSPKASWRPKDDEA